MQPTDRRMRYRAVLAGSECVQPASVFDPVSARLAEHLGFDIAILAGSVASAVILGAPDMTLLTLSEFAGLAKRISRRSRLSLMVDADHGLGNALNVMRTVEEFEAAGVSALSIEDADLPLRFGAGGTESMISRAEMVGKLRAALHARQDPALVVTARTRALRLGGLADCLDRVKAYADTGIDAIALKSAGLDEIEAVHSATGLPILIGSGSVLASPIELAARGVRIASAGNLAFQAAVQATFNTLQRLRSGGTAVELKDTLASADTLDVGTEAARYATAIEDFLTA
jgi:carboxyvinyl-carboxyphosphonate phosphorylmutase